MTAQAERSRWHSVDSFTGPDRTYEVGTLGSMSYLLSPDGKEITDGFHEFLNPFPDLEIDGKRYFVGKIGAMSHILVIAPNGTISDLLKGVKGGVDRGDGRELVGFHTVDYDSAYGLFAGTIGTKKWYVDPVTRIIVTAAERHAEDEKETRRPMPIGLLLLVAAAALAFVASLIR